MNLLLLLVLFSSCSNQIVMKKIIFTENAPAPIGPYSQATEAMGFIFISGQIAIHPATGAVVEGDVSAQAKQVMENLKAIIIASGCTMENVMKCTIYLTDMNDFGKVNEVYGSYFTSEPPARETIEISALPKNLNVEISAIVLKP